jgi:hypothetical protein
MNKKLTLGVAATIVVGLLAAWAFGWFASSNYSSDPQVAELEKLRDETIVKQMQFPDSSRPAKSEAPSPEEQTQRANAEAFRDKIGELSEEQRESFFERSMPLFIEKFSEQFNKRYDNLMAMTPDERRKELDKAIDQMEKRGAGGGGPGGKGGPQRMDPQKMDEFRKKMLDWTTPDQRAKFENSIQMLNDRRKERGLEPMGGPGGGFFLAGPETGIEGWDRFSSCRCVVVVRIWRTTTTRRHNDEDENHEEPAASALRLTRRASALAERREPPGGCDDEPRYEEPEGLRPAAHEDERASPYCLIKSFTVLPDGIMGSTCS